MKRISLIAFSCFLFACNDSSSVKKASSPVSTPAVEVSVKKNSKKFEADLSTPLVAYRSCIDALRRGKEETLSRCLSLPPGEKLNKRIALAKWGYTACGGYNREVLSATETPASGVISDSHGPVAAKPGKIWINYVKPHPKCQNSIGMSKVGDEWRLYAPTP